jgi:hypothetical protein
MDSAARWPGLETRLGLTPLRLAAYHSPLEAEMKRTKKTTILFPPDLHERLSRLAEQEGTSLGDLVRKACEIQYGLLSAETRLEAVRQLAAMSLPVGEPGAMKREAVPRAEDLLP